MFDIAGVYPLKMRISGVLAETNSAPDARSDIIVTTVGAAAMSNLLDNDDDIDTGDEIENVGIRDTQTTTCTGVEMFRKILDEGQAGDNVGILLRGMKKEDVERGMVICKPGSVTPHTKFEGEVYILTKEEGGRHTPFFNGYRPQFYFRTTDVTGVVTLPEGTEMVMPGDNVSFEVELITPIAMEEKLRFAIREGGRTVGAGVVSKIIE